MEFKSFEGLETTYAKTTHPLTHNPMWQVKDMDLATHDDGKAMMEKFIEEYKQPDYTLSIFDNLTKRTIEIDAPLSEMPKIVAYIYRIEKAAPLTFIGANSATKSYVVGMSLTRGNLKCPGSYKAEDGQLKHIGD